MCVDLKLLENCWQVDIALNHDILDKNWDEYQYSRLFFWDLKEKETNEDLRAVLVLVIVSEISSQVQSSNQKSFTEAQKAS